MPFNISVHFCYNQNCPVKKDAAILLLKSVYFTQIATIIIKITNKYLRTYIYKTDQHKLHKSSKRKPNTKLCII